MTTSMTASDLQSTLRRFFTEAPTLSLATVDDAGHPHAANVNFTADDDLNLYFLSSPDSAHSRHIARCPQIAATCYAEFTDARDIRGAQLRGLCTATDPADFDAHWARFCAKFPYAAEYEAHARAERFYHIHPTWARWIDNRVHFGFKMEMDCPL